MQPRDVFFFALAVCLVTILFRWHFRRSAEILQRWADENGYLILEKSYRQFLRGPFFFRASKDQTVYRVLVRDKTGAVRRGWVACGSWWWGLFVDHASVRWDNEGVPLMKAPSRFDRDRWMDA